MSVLLSRRWLVLHVFAAAMLTGCVLLTWWQFDRAQGGNTRSLGYTFQWPIFAFFTVGVWGWLCRDATRTTPRARRPERDFPGRLADEVVLPPLRLPTPDPEGAADPELAAYNKMLKRLAETDDK